MLFVVAGALALLAGCATRPGLSRFSYAQPEMGVPFHIVLFAADRAAADNAAKAAFARIQQLNGILSDYDTDSELSRLSQTGGKCVKVPVGEDLWCLLARSQKMAEESGGAFDVTCGPVVSLWRKARREKSLPDPAKLAEARKAVGYEKLRLDPRARTAELMVPYMRLDLGAIAKGYAADQALKVLRQHGIRRALVSGAGDMVAGDPPPGARGWRIELPGYGDSASSGTNAFVLLRHHGLATSGDLFQYVEMNGVRYSHILDPRTGIGLTDHSVVVVIAPDGTTADALSTTVSVLGPQKGLSIAGRHGACALILRQVAGKREAAQSPCFGKFIERDAHRKNWKGELP